MIIIHYRDIRHSCESRNTGSWLVVHLSFRLTRGRTHVPQQRLRHPAINRHNYHACAAALANISFAYVQPPSTWEQLLAMKPDLQQQIKT